MTYHYAVKETDRNGLHYATYGPFTVHAEAEAFAEKMEEKARESRDYHRFYPVALECPRRALEA